MTSEAKRASSTGPGTDTPWSGYPGFWPPPPISPWMGPYGEAYARMMGTQTSAAPGPAIAAAAPMMMEALRQWIVSRADFWSRTMEAVGQIAFQAATIATEARKAADQMGPGCANLFSPGAPWAAPTAPSVDIDKLKENLKGMDQAEAEKIIYAVQLVQSMDAARRSAAGGNPGRKEEDW
ncbi:MAG: hypothetical protein JO122_03895 [Acetobacteraceae bacterium]|nr:hypothetical protein [Acetobacteraceae bacterium]